MRRNCAPSFPSGASTRTACTPNSVSVDSTNYVLFLLIHAQTPRKVFDFPSESHDPAPSSPPPPPQLAVAQVAAPPPISYTGYILSIDARVRQLYERRYGLIFAAATHSVDISFGTYLKQLLPVDDADKHRASDLILPSPAPPSEVDLLAVLRKHPMANAALDDILTWLKTHYVACDPSAQPPSTAALLYRKLETVYPACKRKERRYTVDELEGPFDAAWRADQSHPALTTVSINRSLPLVTWCDSLNAFLYHLVLPFWSKGTMLWRPAPVYASCALSGTSSRFYGHPYSCDLAILHADLAEARAPGRSIKVLEVAFSIDASDQHKKKILNFMACIFPQAAAYRTDRARETFLTMGSIAVPKEIRKKAVRGVFSALGTALYHRAVYDAVVQPLNQLIENGMASSSCVF